MDGERLLEILDRLTTSEGGSRSARVCAVAADVTGMNGAGVMIVAENAARGSLCSSNQISALIEDLQFTLGEGPCIDAHREGRPVLEPDLADPIVARWLAFAPQAVRAGALAVFGFPIQVGRVRLGALNLYREEPGALTKLQHSDALVMADLAGRAVIATQAEAPPGEVAAELESAADFRFIVHQAAGMLSVRLGVPVAEALVRIRAHAFAHDVPVEDVARDVVTRTMPVDDRDFGAPGSI